MWETIIKDILAVPGYNQSRIAMDIDVSKEAVSKLIRGVTREPRYATGHRLMALHSRLRPDLYTTLNAAEPHQRLRSMTTAGRLRETMEHYREE